MTTTPGLIPARSRAMNPLRATLALGCSLLILTGCGGGSSDVPPPSTLAAPTNFSVKLSYLEYFQWSASPGANRYELHADPDGSGPLPEIKLSDYNDASRTGFQYQSYDAQTFTGNVYGLDVLNLTARLNATYRLRACDASGCGDFTAPRSLDIVNGISHEFPSGRTHLSSSMPFKLSKDSLTLAIAIPRADADSAVYLFGRASSTQPWQQQALLRTGKANFADRIALSADGTTLAAHAWESVDNASGDSQSVVYTYQRSGSTWLQQATLNAPSAPSTCPQPCRAVGSDLALSADGNLLAMSLGFNTSAGVGSTSIGAVATYVRNDAIWSPQALLETGGPSVELMALSDDGKTLAVNQGAFYRNTPSPQTTTPFALIFTQQDNGTWSQQARIPVGIVYFVDIAAGSYSTMKLSGDGNTLAVLARNAPGYQPPELDIHATDLSCGPMVGNMYMALFARNGTAWQRQAAVSRGYSTWWALASDGSGLFYGDALFSRSNGVWACP